MSTKAIKKKRDEGALRSDWKPVGERAPSIIRKDQPTGARTIAAVALMLLIVGAFAIVMSVYGDPTKPSLLAAWLGLGWGIFFVMLGFAGLLYHAFVERDPGYRRLYGFLGIALLGLGVIVRIWPQTLVTGDTTRTVIGGHFLSLGAPALFLSLCFLVSFVRHEPDIGLRFAIGRVLLVVAIVLIAIGLIGGLLFEQYLLGPGVIHLLLGMMFAAAYIAIESPNSTRGHWAGIALGVIGVAMIVIAMGKGLPLENVPWLAWINRLFSWVKWLRNQPGEPILFAYMGLEFLLLSVGICSDNQLVVLTRRELGSFFFSPVAYIVLIALTVMGGYQFLYFVNTLAQASQASMMGMGGVPEPIVRIYIFSLVPVICAILVVPIITMRLLSEEHRSGTLEVLLTAPVKESTVVVSKFLAALRVFMLAWYPWGLYLVALWVEGGTPFDYRPILSFALALLVTGSAFVAMGLFFSSVTKNQIVSAILGLMGMIFLLALFLLKDFASGSQSPMGMQQETFWSNLLTYVNFLDLWLQTSMGQVAPRMMLFHVSFAIVFLFLTVKVLESRKWR